jgi:hypothetical protein
MTGEPENDDTRPRLGDLLADGAAWRNRPPPEPPSLTDQAWNPAPLDGVLVWLARHYDEDAEQVLQDLRGNTALARLLRKVLDHADMSRDLRAHLMRESLPDSMSAVDKNRAVAQALTSERDATGRRAGGLTPSSVARTARRGRQEFEELEWRRKFDALADLFVPKT